MTRIGIIGSGNMGRSLGVRFAKLGHEVCFGGRTASAPERAARLAGTNARVGTIDDAARFGAILIWTPRERDPAQVMTDVGLLAGKVVVDLNNRDYANEVKGDSRWFDRSLGEQLEANLPEALVVKAFNTVAMEALDTSADALRQAQAQIFVAGHDEGARRQVKELAGELGFSAVDLGGGKTAMRIADAPGDAIRFVMIDRGYGGRANIAIQTLPAPDLGYIGERQSSAYQ